jgi:ElaB/YqjD/DUF883 family membrane-anchored ribosome-binding protein
VTKPEDSNIPAAKAGFTRALDEAKAGAAALGKEAQDRAGAYRDQLSGKSADLIGDARELSGQAKERALALAEEGKTKASDALTGLGKIVADNAAAIDEKLGAKYGDYARTAARSIQETAVKLETKELEELGEDAKAFVRKSPGLAVGIAAAVGFFLARLFRGSRKDTDA